jgi:hypothetical protein
MFRTVRGDIFLANCGRITTTYDPDGSLRQTIDSAMIFRSSDDGVTWINVTGDLHTAFVRGFGAVTTREYPSRDFLVVSTLDTLYTSTEGGGHWKTLGTYGMTFYPANAPLAADDEYIYLGYGGVIRGSWSEATITSIDARIAYTPAAYTLSQNFPNPFNPTTTIRYGVPVRTHLTLTVFNTLGQKVAELVNGEVEAGYHDVQFDASKLASGVYFYQLKAGNRVQARKLLLIR